MSEASLRGRSIAPFGAAIAALLLLTSHGFALAAEGVTSPQKRAATEFLGAVASGSPQSVAYAIHPADLEALRTRILTLLREEAQRGDSTVRGRLFGPGMPLTDIERLTSINFYATLGRRLQLSGREYGDFTWLAAVPDRGDSVNVVLRGKPPKERGTVQVVQIVTLKPYGKDWKAALPTEIEAQIDDLIHGRGPMASGRPAPASVAAAPSAPGAAGNTTPPAGGSAAPAAVRELLDSAEKALTEGRCEDYYREYVSPNFRRVMAKKALEALIGNCQRNLGTREMLVSTLQIVRKLEPSFQYEGQRAVYDLKGQGLPYDRFILEQVNKRWYVAE